MGFAPTPANLSTARLIRETLRGFCLSADKTIKSEHLGKLASVITGAAWALSTEYPAITEYATRLWQRMIDPNSGLPIIHDAYLKLYALNEPQWDYDYILLDEGQDTNDVTAQMFFSQRARKVLVGDRHQNIYTFRLSYDILTPKARAGAPTYPLTHSFRFGQPIADLASFLLKTTKGEQFRLTGRGGPSRILAPFTAHWELKADGSYCSHTLITRTNASLFHSAVQAVNCIEGWEAATGQRGPRIGFVGTDRKHNYSPLHAFKFGRLVDIVSLAENRHGQIEDPFVRRFRTLQDLELLVSDEKTFDVDLLAAIRLYKHYKAALPTLVSRITERASDPNDPAVWVRYTTAHKAKGAEWPRVRLANDFSGLVTDGRLKSAAQLPAEEINLIYVALTRAKNELEIHPRLMEFLVATNGTRLVQNPMEPRNPDMNLDFSAGEWAEFYRARLPRTPQTASNSNLAGAR